MRSVRGLGAVLLLSLALAAAAQEGGDLQAQILYAYQTEDFGELGNLVQRLGNQVKAGGADAALRYHLAHAEYRFGLLAQRERRKAAGPAFSDCIDQLKPVIDQDRKSAEALALQSACYSRARQGSASGGRAAAVPCARRGSSPRLELAPRNPRVLYLVAMDGFARSKPSSAESQRAFAHPAAGRAAVRAVLGHARRRARAGGMPRRIWRSACSCRRAATCSARATGSRSP